MKKSKPFKIDLGLGDLYGNKPMKDIPVRSKKIIPTYTGRQYAVFTERGGVIVKHTFKNPDKARGFRIKAQAADGYDVVSDVVYDF